MSWCFLVVANLLPAQRSFSEMAIPAKDEQVQAFRIFPDQYDRDSIDDKRFSNDVENHDKGYYQHEHKDMQRLGKHKELIRNCWPALRIEFRDAPASQLGICVNVSNQKCHRVVAIVACL